LQITAPRRSACLRSRRRDPRPSQVHLLPDLNIASKNVSNYHWKSDLRCVVLHEKVKATCSRRIASICACRGV
ncbi:MAG: hypothetical protein ACK56I_17530, partial [bacterium]